MRDFVQNLPLFSIILCLLSGSGSSMLKGRAAKWVNTVGISLVGVMSMIVMLYCTEHGSFVYMMGHFPAPWGNEIRAGVLEGFMAMFFCIIMLLSMLGGRKKIDDEVESTKHNLYYILVDLLLCSLIALVYTNDFFTAYVFVEINTIAACGLIMIRQNGRTIEAAVRYLIMSQVGSGLFLVGICMLYDLTGHLLMSNIREAIAQIVANGTYSEPMLVSIALITVGLAIKSALFPFHSWLPDAYGYSNVSSAAILSSLVSKGYIFLLIKIMYRVVGFDVIINSKVLHVLFIFGLIAMVSGSVSAIHENDIRRMIAFSSVAQIGYIYMGLGMGTMAGVVASIFHILAHAATKSMLFISAIGLTDVSGGSRHFKDLTGAAYRNRIAGLGFAAGSLSMVGIPLFSGFVSKLLFMESAVELHWYKMLPALVVLGISTILNAVYFMKTVIRIYTPVGSLYDGKEGYEVRAWSRQKLYTVTIILFIIVNSVLGLCSGPIIDLIQDGLGMFT